MKKLTFEKFKFSHQLISFVSKNNIRQEDIQSISTGRNWITLYYWIDK